MSDPDTLRDHATTTMDRERLPSVLGPLMAMPHWVLWRWEEKNGKRTKVP